MEWLSSMLADGQNGSVSSKRVITFAAFLLCTAAFIANMFFGYKIDQFIYESMSYIAMAGLGVTVAEKFAGSRQAPTQTTTQAPTNAYTTTTTAVARTHTPLPIQKDPLI